MSFKVDDGFADSKKVEALFANEDPWEACAAVALWTLMGSDCAQLSRTTDGVFTLARLRRVVGVPPRVLKVASDLLVKYGLWERSTDQFAFRNWLQWQKSAVEKKRIRTLGNERQRRLRMKQRGFDFTEESGDGDASPTTSRDASRNGGVTPSVTLPSPIQSLPVQEEERESASRSSRARACACPREGEPGEFTDGRQRELFERCYREVRRDSPNMNGRATKGFHQRVLDAARLRERDPEELFLSVLEQWLGGELNTTERSVPYACFAHAWGSLLDEPETTNDGQSELVQQANEALKRNDFARYNEIQRKLAALNGGDDADAP